MAPRRSPSALSPQDPLLQPPSNSSSPSHLLFPRSTSPSSGFTTFLSKPSKWFNRKASETRFSTGPAESRSSTSSVGRKPRISQPTDPRPILSTFRSESRVSSASRSVLDLSTRPQPSFDLSHPFSSSSQPPSPDVSSNLGDLRTISRKAWSKSADDLGKLSSNHSPVDVSFKHRIQDYRNRSNSSATISELPSSASTLHPFPTMPSFNPSHVKLETVPKPPISISISSPLSEEPEEMSQAHVRSHSFTPRLPSKLATLKPGVPPPSPKRKASSPSQKDTDPAVDRDGERSPIVSSPSQTFSFNLVGEGPVAKQTTTLQSVSSSSGSANNSIQPPLSPMLLSPPAGGGNKEGNVTRDSKRVSQIVYHSGFLNRFADFSSFSVQPGSHVAPGDLSLSKGWKSFKAELKGSKLYFYKPPSDRNAAIKELFPTDLVAPSVDDEIPVDLPSEVHGGRGSKVRDEGTIGRKRRAYWGRRTHPELVHSEKGILKGTFEALVHEAVFSSTFEISGDHEGALSDKFKWKPEWKDFSSSVLLSLPLLVGRTQFETEYIRCCTNFLGGVDSANREQESNKVIWLSKEYLRYHGGPADVSGWEEWRAGNIPAFVWRPSDTDNVSGIPKSSSMQALYVPSPDASISSPTLGENQFSPNLSMFSPRPNDIPNTVPLMAVLDSADRTSPKQQDLHMNAHHDSSSQLQPDYTQSDKPSSASVLWSLLERDGLSREVLLMLDPDLISQSLRLFHRNLLQGLPDNITASDCILVDSKFSVSPDADRTSPPSVPHLEAFFGSNDSPHWLTKLILSQILAADHASTSTMEISRSQSSSRLSNERGSPTSRTHSRSEVISIWAKVGESCRLAGDECSWQAVLTALCSRPVARLDKAWKRVDRQALSAVDSWVHTVNSGSAGRISEPMMTPWGGDIKSNVKQALRRAKLEDDTAEWSSEPLYRVRDLFEGFRTKLSLCPRSLDSSKSVSQEAWRLVPVWRTYFENSGATFGLAARFKSVEQFMSLSLAAEPRRKGLFEPHFWAQALPTSNAISHPLVPLLFPEILPTSSLFDRSTLWRGRLESGPTRLTVQQLQLMNGLSSSIRSGVWSHESGLDARGGDERLLNIGNIDLHGSSIPIYDGELLVTVYNKSESASRPTSRAPSRPPSSAFDKGDAESSLSRTPSMRLSAGSAQSLERKASVARRSSLPSISPRPPQTGTEPSSEKSLRVVVQAGTLDRLVNVLVHGLQGVTVSISDDNGEKSLRETKTRDLFVDHAEFANVWWKIFQSFVTPIVFFELLRKKFVGVLHTSTDSAYVTRVRSEVLETLNEWLTFGSGVQDSLDDIHLFNAVRSFLDGATEQPTAPISDLSVEQARTTLDNRRKSILVSFIAHTMRPPMDATANIKSTSSSLRHKFSTDVPDIDRMHAEELVDNLDAIAAAALSHVNEEDLFTAADLLEIQTADNTGWFLNREAASSPDDVEIQTIYSHLMEIEPSPLISELSQPCLYRLLPPSLRSCIRAYTILRKWIISKIVAPKLGPRLRQARVDILVRALEVSRLRSSHGVDSNTRPCVPSFVEAVISSAVVSIESRLHYRAWQNAASFRGVQCDALTSLLTFRSVHDSASHNDLAVDIGWILERILEIISIPNAVTPSMDDNQCIVNFEKRRHLCDFVKHAFSLISSRRGPQRDDSDRKDIERLNTIEKELMNVHFDHRVIRDEAQREALQTSIGTPSSAKKSVRPFHKLVAAQQDKNKRDKFLRERLVKDKKQRQQREEKRDDYLNKAMRPKKPALQLQKQHRNKKSVSTAFFQLMRPISSAFTDNIYPSAVKRSAAELDFVPNGKPALVVNIVDAKVAPFNNNKRSFVFQLHAEDGGHYLLQAISKQDMARWLEQISRIAQLAAKRRLTYLGNSPKPQLADHIHSATAVHTHDPTAVFGVDLDFLLQREVGESGLVFGAVPSVVEQCLAEIESRGLAEVGIYRIAGATSEIAALRQAFNRGESPITSSTDIYAICDLMKTWLRVLPEPVFPSSSYYSVIDAIKLEDHDARLSTVRGVVRSLPQANFDLLKRVIEHLDKVADYEEQNQMTAEALAIVFSPNLLRAPQNDFAMIIANMGHTHKLVKTLITQVNVIFDIDHEIENEAEDDIDEPIPEEDENMEEEDDSPFAAPTTEQTSNDDDEPPVS